MNSGRIPCLGAFFWGLLLAVPAVAGSGDACSCKNLNVLQEEYQNAVYMEKSFRDLAKALKDWEATAFKRAKLQSPPLDVLATSRAMVDKAAKENMFVPFPQDDSHAGFSVDLLPETCVLPEDDVKHVEGAAPCSGAAEAEIVSAVGRQLACEKMGVDNYWGRPGSAFALEKAESYKIKSELLKSQIGLALDQAEIKVSGDWPYTVEMPGMKMDYHFTFQSSDINRASSKGDKWDFSAKGETRHTMMGANFEGLSCTGGGEVVHKFTVKMQTDGLTFSLVFDGQLGGGEHVVSCEGVSVPMPPTEGSGWGQFNTPNLPLSEGITDLPSDWTGALAPLGGSDLWLLTGISVTGDAKTSLEVSCPMP